jgi:hypothetical protein
LLYTVPTGNTLIVFKKKIEAIGGGSAGDVEVVFKEEISGNRQACAVVNVEELIKERYESGTSIYVNATASCVAILEGILFDANMVPMIE